MVTKEYARSYRPTPTATLAIYWPTGTKTKNPALPPKDEGQQQQQQQQVILMRSKKSSRIPLLESLSGNPLLCDRFQ